MNIFFDWFTELGPVVQALIATTFTWGVTALGASMVFFFKTIHRNVLNGMLGFAAGVMIAASFWSLLNPAIIMAEEAGVAGWIPAVTGFLFGGVFLWGVDRLLPHMHIGAKESEGPPTSLGKSTLLVLAITLHNIPEGLAVGVAFAAVASGYPGATLLGAIALAIGIGLQNFPEGAAVSIPLRREGMSRWKSFLYGQSSALVEPVAGVVGAALVLLMKPILPYALAFAAGAMIYVVVEEIIPEAQQDNETDVATIGVMIGFAIMMFLDVALG
jgi:ZIP family zinc transporter